MKKRLWQVCRCKWKDARLFYRFQPHHGWQFGSPAIDAKGNLIGLNFDHVWEGTMSDLNYDPSICRNIMVDARYILFVIDKFAGAGHLVNEMKLGTSQREKNKTIKYTTSVHELRFEKLSPLHVCGRG